jgi:hypothetical protein
MHEFLNSALAVPWGFLAVVLPVLIVFGCLDW